MFTPRCRPEFEADVVVAGVLRYADERIAVVNFNRVDEDAGEVSRNAAGLRARLPAAFPGWGGAGRGGVVAAGWSSGGEKRIGAGRPSGPKAGGRARVYAQAKRPEFAAATAEHLRVFLGEMKQPLRCLDSAREAREILRTVFAGYESARPGRRSDCECDLHLPFPGREWICDLYAPGGFPASDGGLGRKRD